MKSRTRSSTGRRNRQRGQEGEREFVAWLRAAGIEFEDRRLGQERDGGVGDVQIRCLGLVEVKRRRRVMLDALFPAAIIAVRGDRGEWWLCLRGSAAQHLLRQQQGKHE